MAPISKNREYGRNSSTVPRGACVIQIGISSLLFGALILLGLALWVPRK